MLLHLFVDQLYLRYISVNRDAFTGFQIVLRCSSVNLETSIGLSNSFSIYQA